MARAQAEIDARKYLDTQSLQAQQLQKQDEESEYNRRLTVAEMTGNYSGMSKWWSQDEIAAAEGQWKIRNTPRATYSGGGSSNKGQLTYSQLVSSVNQILENSRDPITGQYTAAGIKQARDYIIANGHIYANALLGILPQTPGGSNSSGTTGSTGSTGTKPYAYSVDPGLAQTMAGQNTTTIKTGERYTPDQYNKFVASLGQTGSAVARVSMIDAAVKAGRITQAQGEALLTMYGIDH